MSHKHGFVDTQSIKDRDIVGCPRRNVIAVLGLTGWKKASAGDPDDMEGVGELEGKLVEDVRVVAGSGEQHHSLFRTAPIQHLQLYARRTRGGRELSRLGRPNSLGRRRLSSRP